MQQVVAHEVVDILAAAAQEAEILDALDRTADKRVGGAFQVHGQMTIVARTLIKARATLIAANAEVLGLLREGLPCS